MPKECWGRLGLDFFRLLPLPGRVKWRLIWLASPKTIFVACALIRASDGRLLMLRGRAADEWELPGGHVERHESADEALRRECREELGLGLTSMQFLGVFPSQKHLTQCAVFRCCLEPGAIHLSAEHRTYRHLLDEEVPYGIRLLIAAAERAHARCADMNRGEC
ncbi:MAG: NUDIX hydrolase [Dehalococcoidia bacterium]